MVTNYKHNTLNQITSSYQPDHYTSASAPIKVCPEPLDSTYTTMERLEARYFYLPNGLLSRVELGQKNVQGTDYAYTLQGWLKDINGYKTDDGNLANSDIGRDGQLSGSTVNSQFCRDAFSSMLQYHQGDYRPVSGNNYFNMEYSAAIPLYNGNISALTTDYLTTGINPLIKFFRYDKLNRIKRMLNSFGIENPQCYPSYNYSSHYSYDYNGNLDTLIRYDNEANELHHIEYEYLSGNNRLDSITAWWGISTGSYRYDAIGNLIRDNGKGLDISWNAAGKVDTIWKNGNVLSTFSYSATGQRQVKKTGKITDYYIHDASGNVMCIYRQTLYSLETIERPIYGNKRLGILRQPVDLFSSGDPFIPNFTIGTRQYELTDHLDNVMATILDRRQPYSSGDNTYKPYIISTTDYYPFGYPISNRSTDIGGYRYFFNGQESDNEVFGETANFGYEFRQYDSRLGRWWSVDPKWNEYPNVSPFVFCNGSPIMMADVKGKEAWKPAVDKNGNIIAIQEDGDNYDSFQSFMGPAYGENDLQQMYGQLQEGQINLTQSYGHQFEVMTNAINEAKNNPNFEKEENYNCWGASLALSRGDRLYGNGPDKWLPWSLDGVGVNSPFLFDIALNSSYKPVSKENASVGLTVMRFGMIGLGNNKHGSIYMGRDNAGNEYTFTKNGWNARPIICMTKQIQGYGYVNGDNWNESGYYVHEKIGGQQ